MIIKKAYTSKEKSIYRCDKCRVALIKGEDKIYIVPSKEACARHQKVMWHLCERDYMKIYSWIEKGKGGTND